MSNTDDHEPEPDPCPCCGDELHVGHRIYCLRGCPLKWPPHGSLIEDDGEYPEVCPHGGDWD